MNPPSAPRRLARPMRLATGLGAVAIGAVLALGSPGSAAPSASDTAATVVASGSSASEGVAASGVSEGVAATGSDVFDVVEVSGFLDGIMAQFIERSIDKASAEGSLGLVLQVNSPLATVDNQRLAELAARIRSSDVPVSMWVGPSGAVAKGAVGQLAGVVSDLALAPGSELGNLGPLIVPAEHLAEPFADAYPAMRDRAISFAEAIELGLAREAPTLPFFVLDLPGFETEVDASGDEPLRVPVSRVRFAKLSPDRPVHAHRGQSRAGLFAVPRRSWAARLRALHRGRWHRRGPGRAVLPAWLLRAGGAPGSGLGRRAAGGGHVRLCRRHPDRRAKGLDRDRHRVPGGRITDPVQWDVVVLGHAAGGDRRGHRGNGDRHARNGPHPLRDPKDRTGLDDRRPRRRPGTRWTPMGWSSSTALRGGPAPSGPPPSGQANRSG